MRVRKLSCLQGKHRKAELTPRQPCPRVQLAPIPQTAPLIGPPAASLTRRPDAVRANCGPQQALRSGGLVPGSHPAPSSPLSPLNIRKRAGKSGVGGQHPGSLPRPDHPQEARGGQGIGDGKQAFAHLFRKSLGSVSGHERGWLSSLSSSSSSSCFTPTLSLLFSVEFPPN